MRITDLRRDDHPEINLIPLIDVILVLVIFFVVTTTFDSRAVLRLQLPQAQGEPAEATPQVLTVLVNAEGHYLVGDREPLRNDVDAVFAHGIDAVSSVLYRPCTIDEALTEGNENLRMAARNIAAILAMGLELGANGAGK